MCPKMPGLDDMRFAINKLTSYKKMSYSSEAKEMLSDCATLTTAFLACYVREVKDIKLLDDLFLALGITNDGQK
jgi:hypothetical protein